MNGSIRIATIRNVQAGATTGAGREVITAGVGQHAG